MAGKSYRDGISLIEIMRQFPDDATAEAWFIERRWPDGIHCPHCGSDNVQTGAKHKTMPYRCREKECAKRFSAKTGTVMEGSKLGFQVWMIATYLLSTSLKSVSSMKLHRDLKINQRSAWFLAHRLRVALADKGSVFVGPTKADETYMGGQRKNMHKDRQAEFKKSRGPVGTTPIPKGSSPSGRCSSGPTREPSTRCRRSIWTATFPSLRPGTIFAKPTPSKSWARSRTAASGRG